MSLYGKEIKKNSIFATNISIIYMDKTTTELILIRISGLDRPGLTASITEILSGYDVDIMDIGQADIHSTLSLGILSNVVKRFRQHHEGPAFQSI